MREAGRGSSKLLAGSIAGAIVVLLALLATGCLDRSGIAGRFNTAKLTVEPEIACPNDSVVARWDLTMLPRDGANCRRCATTANCPDGFGCLDGTCCRNADLAGGSACVVANQCLPSTIDMALTASDAAVSVPALPRPLPLRGGVSVPVNQTMDIVAAGPFALPFERIDDRARVRVPNALDDRLPFSFKFTCEGSTPAWTLWSFDVAGPRASSLVRIESVRNTNPFPIVVSGGVPRRDGIRIEAGAVSTAFAGSAVRGSGAWTAFIPPDGRPGVAVCGPTGVGRLPDIGAEARIGCR